MTSPLLIYVAGPLSAETAESQLANVERALRAGHRILDRGHYPLIPHLTHFFEAWCQEAIGGTPEYEIYLAWDFVMLRRCDGLLYLASSPGADRELALAESLGMPVWRDERMIPRVTP